MTVWTDEMKAAAMKDAAAVVKLTAENARLRTALTKITNGHPESKTPRDELIAVQITAYAALHGRTPVTCGDNTDGEFVSP